MKVCVDTMKRISEAIPTAAQMKPVSTVSSFSRLVLSLATGRTLCLPSEAQGVASDVTARSRTDTVLRWAQPLRHSWELPGAIPKVHLLVTQHDLTTQSENPITHSNCVWESDALF